VPSLFREGSGRVVVILTAAAVLYKLLIIISKQNRGLRKFKKGVEPFLIYRVPSLFREGFRESRRDTHCCGCFVQTAESLK